MTAPDTAMVFAAGRGTRMGALTADRPKPMIEVAGKPLIDHALTLVRDAGIGRVVVNTHYKAEVLASHLGRHWPNAALSHEDVLLETGGGLRHALPLLGAEPVFTLNADAIWQGTNPLAALRAAWDPARMDALLLLLPRERALGHKQPGDFFLEEGRLVWRGGAATAPYVYLGAQIMRTETLGQIGDEVFSLLKVWDGMVAKGRAFGVVYDGQWVDLGQPESIPLAEGLTGT